MNRLFLVVSAARTAIFEVDLGRTDPPADFGFGLREAWRVHTSNGAVWVFMDRSAVKTMIQIDAGMADEDAVAVLGDVLCIGVGGGLQLANVVARAAWERWPPEKTAQAIDAVMARQSGKVGAA